MRSLNWVKAAAGVCLAFGAVAWADDPAAPRSSDSEKKADAIQAEVHRASTLKGQDLVNTQKERLGAIRDLVVDEQGRVRYAIISDGAVATHYISVPFGFVRPGFDRDNSVIDIARDKFISAPAYTRDNYYDRWTTEWRDLVHQYFEQHATRTPESMLHVQKIAKDAKPAQLFYTSQLIGGNVVNNNREKLGSIDDLVIDGSHRVSYVVIGSGGVLNIGKHEIAAPFAATELRKGDKDTAMAVVNVDSKQLEAAPRLADSQYRDLLNADFIASTNRFFGVTGVRREIEAETPRAKP